MPHPYWPLFDLRVRTPRLELRWIDEDDAVELAALAARGVHDPEYMPFQMPWTDQPSPQLERSALQHYWLMRASWKPEAWNMGLVTRVEGAVVGSQGFGAREFAITREVSSGSWLGLAHQGKGIGKEMRAAMLHLAFEGLGARAALSGAFDDNHSSLGVSRALGYDDDGEEWHVRRGEAARVIRLRLTRERWEERRRDDIEIEGLGPCLGLFGLGASGDDAG